jgi:Putative zincin peptidase
VSSVAPAGGPGGQSLADGVGFISRHDVHQFTMGQLVQPSDLAPTETSVQATLSHTFAMVFGAIVMGIPCVAIVATFLWLWGPPTRAAVISAMLLGVVGLMVHEPLHGVGYLWAGASRDSVRFGVQWSKLMAYAHCLAPLRASKYRVCGALPGLVLGIIPTLGGLMVGSGGLLLFGVSMLFCSGGDAAVLWAIRGVPGEAWVKDHPSLSGCIVLR